MPDFGRLLGSWKLSVVLMVVVAFYYGLLVVWAALSPPDVVQRIATLLPFWIMYLLLLVNTGVCLWRRLPALKRDIRAEPAAIHFPATATVPTGPDVDIPDAEGLLRRLGFKKIRTIEGGLWGVRQRWAPLGTFLFHGSFFLLLTAAALTMAARNEQRIWVAVGEEFTGSPDQVLGQSMPSVLLIQQPPPLFAVESISPEFWNDQLLFTRLEATLVFPDGDREVTRINRPLWKGWWTFLRLSGFGYAPRYELRSRTGTPLESAFVKMNVFPPGRRDFFSPEAYPHRIEVEVLPDAVAEEGLIINRGYSLDTPAVFVRVSRGKLGLGEALLGQGSEFGFEGLSLSFPEIRYWGEFAVVQDPGAPVLFVAFALGLAGLLLKARGGRTEALWTQGESGEEGGVRLWGRFTSLPVLPEPAEAES